MSDRRNFLPECGGAFGGYLPLVVWLIFFWLKAHSGRLSSCGRSAGICNMIRPALLGEDVSSGTFIYLLVIAGGFWNSINYCKFVVWRNEFMINVE